MTARFDGDCPRRSGVQSTDRDPDRRNREPSEAYERNPRNVLGVEHCDECGFVYDLGEAEQAARGITEGVETLADTLRLSPTDLARRTDPFTWSVLEYGCHVRDVLLVQRERVLLARRKDQPSLEPMGRDERVEHDGYAVQDPHDVARQLNEAARMFAHDLARLGSDDWDRIVIYNYPELRERSLRWVALHTLHEVRHHLLDVQRQL
jgi:hypothetical protein